MRILQRSQGALDWSQCLAVERVPEKVTGTWVLRNTRMPVAAVSENLEEGVTIDELVELYYGLTLDHVKAVLALTARSLSSDSLCRGRTFSGCRLPP